MPTDGKHFEDAVDRFVKSLGPGATVRYDGGKSSEPDRGPRQSCDAFVEKLHSHSPDNSPNVSPVKYLIRQSDKSGKLGVEDIRAFKGHVDAVGASSGALYSRAGFTAPALARAKSIGIACCTLHAHRPADVPAVVNVGAFYARAEIRVDLKHIESLSPRPATWGELFAREIQDESGNKQSTLDAICAAFLGAQAASIAVREERGLAFPPDVSAHLQFAPSQAEIRVTAHWRRFRAPLRSHLINGSIAHPVDNFLLGHQSSPRIDPAAAHPGPAWEEVSPTPTTPAIPLPPNSRHVLHLISNTDPRQALIEQLAERPLPSRPAIPELASA
jgi:hypothetical protein